ncbi:MAG: Panacea domain-containing protein [Pseudomonadota bacterium]
MNKVPVIIEALCYILTKLRKADKIHLVKIMYLADKYHIMNYGRTVSGDDFFALQHGPTGSCTMDVLEFDSYVLGEYMERAKDLIETSDGLKYKPSDKCFIDDFEMISESDIGALDFAIENFGYMDKWDVVNYTHKLEEWKQFEHLFNSQKTKRESIKITDLLLSPNDKYFSIPKEHIEESRQIATGSID